MKKLSRFVILLIAAATLSAIAQAASQKGAITSKGTNGESYEVEFYGNLELSPDRVLSSAMMRGKGQYQVNKSLLATSEDITDISSTSIEVEVAGGGEVKPPLRRPETETKHFAIVPSTKLCRNGRAATWDTFKKGEMITVTTKIGEKTALSVRSGPMLFGNLMSIPQLMKYDCEQ